MTKCRYFPLISALRCGRFYRFDRFYAFTLVELLVVIAIIGILIGLLLPAVQSVREAARNLQCKNNMKQMGLAALNHESLQKSFPTGGWGYDWVGNPEYGFGKKQPGGFFYNILPFMEQSVVHDYSTQTSESAKTGATRMIETPIPAFYCPSRRGVGVYANDQPSATWGAPKFGGTSGSERVNQVQKVARTDYCGNAGNGTSISHSGPSKYSESYTYTGYGKNQPNGVVYIQSEVRISAISDGLTNTAMLAEKLIVPEHYEDGKDAGDNQSCYTGGDVDLIRYMGTTSILTPSYTKETFPVKDVFPPACDSRQYDKSPYSWHAMGSAHSSALNVVLCDGSVVGINYEIDLFVYSAFGNRMDQQIIDNQN